MQPTEEAYSELQTAFDFFNSELFGGELPGCLITLQREKHTYGYFASDRFMNAVGEKSHEIAMNPSYFAVVPPVENMQTLVHEMTHLWQFVYGKPGRRGYHNKEWAGKMQEIGLMPSDTGKEGGKMLGDKMGDYIIPGGPFEAACSRLFTADFAITWMDRAPVKTQLEHVLAGEVEGISVEELAAVGFEVEQATPKSNRDKYSCTSCNEVNVWGRPGLFVKCGNCDQVLVVLGRDAGPAD